MRVPDRFVYYYSATLVLMLMMSVALYQMQTAVFNQGDRIGWLEEKGKLTH